MWFSATGHIDARPQMKDYNRCHIDYPQIIFLFKTNSRYSIIQILKRIRSVLIELTVAYILKCIIAFIIAHKSLASTAYLESKYKM